MAFKPVVGSPGRFLDTDTGKILEIRDFFRWESSDRFEGMLYRLDTSKHSFVIEGISLSVDKTPTAQELQQQVTLVIGEKTVLETPLFNLVFYPAVRAALTEGSRDERSSLVIVQRVAQDVPCVVKLSERPVEGCGLRIHLKGFRR